MKDELRSAVAEAMAEKSASQAEICRGGKIRKSLFFCPAYLSVILPLGREPWSAVKLGQSGPARRSPERFRGEGGSNRCFWSKCPSNGENQNQGLSQCVAVSRSDLEKNSFLPFCGHFVSVNPPDRSGVRHPNWACRAVLSAVAAPAKEEAFAAKAGQTDVRRQAGGQIYANTLK
jgi:hypothetical protein